MTVSAAGLDLAGEVRARYAAPEWHVEREMTLGSRRLDVVAFNLWSSRSHRIVGFECKTSRGDWLRELGDHQKAEEWQRVVDEFYLVTTPKLVKPEELPAGWGHLELCGSRMMTRRYPTRREPGPSLPREISARFLARMLVDMQRARHEVEHHIRVELRGEIEAGYRASAAKELERERAETAEIRQQYNEILKALGVAPLAWSAHAHAMEAAGFFANHQREASKIVNMIRRAAGEVGSLHASMEAASAKLGNLEAALAEGAAA